MSYRSQSSAAATTIATLTTDEQSARRVADLVADEFFADDGAISLVDAGRGQWRVTFYFRHETDERRVRALLRRAAGLATSEIDIGPLKIDTRASRVIVDGNPVKLTSLEYRLLAYLAHHKGKVVSRTELVEHLYDQDFDRDSNTIEVFVGRLRKKLGVNVIQTVRGLGYCLDDSNVDSENRAKA